MTKPSVRVLGIGSPFGVDRIGWLVAELADRDASAGVEVEVRCLDRPGIGLIDELRDADAAVLVDAMRAGTAPGEVHRLDAAQLAADRERLSSHGLGVAESLALARALDALPPVVVVIGVEVADAERLDEVWDATTRRRAAAVLARTIDGVAARRAGSAHSGPGGQ